MALLRQTSNLNVKMCWKQSKFFGARKFRLADRLKTDASVVALPSDLSWTMLALELKFPGNCFVSLLTLCYAMQVCSWCIGTGASRILVLQVCIAILLCLVTVASSHWDRHSQDAI